MVVVDTRTSKNLVPHQNLKKVTSPLFVVERVDNAPCLLRFALLVVMTSRLICLSIRTRRQKKSMKRSSGEK